MRPIICSLGPLHLYSYGTMIALGVILAVRLMVHRGQRENISKNTVYDLVFAVLFFGFLGARIFYGIENFDFYRKNPLKIFALWEGGLIFYGGLIASTAAIYIFSRLKKASFLFFMDFLLPYVAFVHAFGRLGCFLNGCCYGKESHLPWAVQFPQLGYPVHPTQIYEMIYNFLVFAVLTKLYSKRTFNGQIMAFYFLFYSLGRFVLEFWREQYSVWMGLTWNQWFSLGLTGVAFWMLFTHSQRSALTRGSR